ncbi:MAG: primosomal protein N' [Proteobacteria bacterium]|nr:primosomal protein N' [Pseudomonadota bacterium]
MTASVAELAIPLPAPGSFHYAIGPELAGQVQVGHVVHVPFGSRRLTGYVLALLDEAPEADFKLRPIKAIAQPDPLFGADVVPLFRWIARYYAHPLGEVVRAALPGATRTASRTMVKLLPEGAQPSLLHDAEIAALLSRLTSSPSHALTQNSLKRRDSVTPATIKRAQRQGLVEVVQEAGEVLAQVRTEPWYALKDNARATREGFSRKGPVRDRLIDWLERFGPVSREAVAEAFPTYSAPLRQLIDKELVIVEERRLDPLAAERVTILDKDRVPHPPTEAQQGALDAISPVLAARTFASFLLHGVTGSGKTEVYLRLAAEVLEDGGSAILLVPEIGLTPQFLARFRARFGDEAVGVLHSGLTDRERFDEWLRIRSGVARLVVGPRSAVFAPVNDLRLVVIDEEHDGSYKQEEGLRYNARDVALVRAQRASAVAVLGSATPSMESYRAAESGRHGMLKLPARAGGRAMPEIELVDLREFPVDDPDSPAAALSPPLKEALETNHASGGQTILLLNRRGFATTVLCTSCGVHFRCDECDVSMTYHARRHSVVCHWCGASSGLPDRCPTCNDAQSLKAVGRGTERLEEEMLALWPDLRVDRMDADTTRSRSGHRRILDRFGAGDVDVLIGTQMVAKGHDFPGVTLVGVVHADAALHLPDFRASERTFQLVSQVAGRAGRGDRPGRVLVQTWHPDHHAIRLALSHDFEGFAERETRLRRGLAYPPFSRLTMFRVSATNERAAERAARHVRTRVDQAGRGLMDVRVLGPAPSPMYKLRGRFRWQVLFKSPDHKAASQLLHRLQPTSLRDEVGKGGGGARVAIDRDPVSFL